MTQTTRIQKRLFCLAALLLIASALPARGFASGNGSSGIGNKIQIDRGVESRVPESFHVIRSGAYLMNRDTGEKLIRIEKLARKDLESFGSELVTARLGLLKGFEYLPKQAQISSRMNFWVVCISKKHCLRFVPLSKSNPAILTLVGGLQAPEK